MLAPVVVPLRSMVRPAPTAIKPNPAEKYGFESRMVLKKLLSSSVLGVDPEGDSDWVGVGVNFDFASEGGCVESAVGRVLM